MVETANNVLHRVARCRKIRRTSNRVSPSFSLYAPTNNITRDAISDESVVKISFVPTSREYVYRDIKRVSRSPILGGIARRTLK